MSMEHKSYLIIGSGITGLCAGALLAEIGNEVRVLEAHPSMVGGHARSFEMQGFRFCAGPQYVWNFGDGEIGNRVLKFLGIEGKIPFDLMDEDGFERIIVGDDELVDIPMGLHRFRQAMVGRFPSEKTGLQRFFSYLGDLAHVSREINDGGAYLAGGTAMKLAALLSRSLSVRAKFRAMRLASRSLADLFDRCGLSPALRRLLYGHEGIFAERESCVSVISYAGATGYYHAGARYPRYGFDSLVNGLRSKIEENGGSVLCGKEVVRLKVDGGRVTKALCADGTTHGGDVFISNISPRLTCALIDSRKDRTFKYVPSASINSCFVGVSDYPEARRKLSKRNMWWYAGYDEVDYMRPDMSNPPRMAYVGSPSSNGEFNLNANANDTSLVVFVPGSFEQAKRAYDESPQKHAELRDKTTDRILSLLDERLFPGLRGRVRAVRTLTPWDLHQELGCEAGNIYGRRMTASSLLRRVERVPRLANLHIACASVGLPGIATGFQTAVLLVEKLTGERIL